MLTTLPLNQWTPKFDVEQSIALAQDLEAGKVLFLPHLAFGLTEREQCFLDPKWADARSKNIGYESASGLFKGAQGSDSDLATLKSMLARYQTSATGLITGLFHHYEASLRIARTSYRPMKVEGRSTSWRKDDSRLHVDAFPSRPNHGERILRVFANVNPNEAPRTWRVGEPFDQMITRFLPRIPRPMPGSAAILQALHITKSLRSEYDHIMLQLHDRMKADVNYQREAPQQTVDFPPGCVWVCFSDQTSHAAMAGQYMFEQTLHLAVSDLYDPQSSPLKVLEQRLGRTLI